MTNNQVKKRAAYIRRLCSKLKIAQEEIKRLKREILQLGKRESTLVRKYQYFLVVDRSPSMWDNGLTLERARRNLAEKRKHESTHLSESPVIE